MVDNLRHWNSLGITDPDQTKGFHRSGGFRGTAIKPIWIVQRMTEEFGPCGEGWGINEPEFTIEHAQDESLVFCTVAVWYGPEKHTLYGVGGDKFRSLVKRGKPDEYTQTDDEAFKKAFTDAVNNALKFLGVGADVHMGLFDDSKYVEELRIKKMTIKAPSSAQMKRDLVDLENDLVDADTEAATDKLAKAWKKKIDLEGWPEGNEDGDFRKMVADIFAEHRKRLELEAIERKGDQMADMADRDPADLHPLEAG
jgi:hypothetical protein